jgi:hypothetical protein
MQVYPILQGFKLCPGVVSGGKLQVSKKSLQIRFLSEKYSV